MIMPHKGDEFHHFGWNACSSALSPLTGHAFLERRYLIIPGIRSSRIYVIDIKAGPTPGEDPQDHRARGGLRQDRLFAAAHRPLRAGRHLRLHARRRRRGRHRRTAGIFIMDCETFEVIGRWEIDRGSAGQALRFLVEPAARLHGVQRMGAAAAVRERHRAGGPARATNTATALHFWDLRERRNVQTIDLGANHQMALEVRPAHDPVREYGFCGVVVDTTNLEGSIWTWWRRGRQVPIKKTATIPPEPADADDCRGC